MKKEDIIRKLTSRKFWAAVTGFVTALLLAFGVGENEITQVVGIVTAGATLIAYIVGEGMVDAARAKDETDSPVKEVKDDGEGTGDGN